MKISEEIVARFSAGTLPELITACVFKEHPDLPEDELKATAISLHNDAAIDLLSVVPTLRPGREEGYDFWVVKHFYEEVIPDLEADVPIMMAAVRALVAGAGNDLVAGTPHSAYRKWAEKDGRAVRTLDAVDPDNSSDGVFFMLALDTLGKIAPQDALDRITGYLLSGAAAAQVGAARAIGAIDLSAVPAGPTYVLEFILSTIQSGRAEQVVGELVDAAVNIGIRSHGGDDDAVIKVIAAASNEASAATIHWCATSLMFHANKLSPAICAALTSIALLVPIANLGTVDYIDAASGELIRGGRVDEGLALIEPLLAANPELQNMDKLDNARYSLLQRDTNTLGNIVVKWLATGDQGMAGAVAGLISHVHGDPATFSIDFSDQNISQRKAVFIARKAIGFLFTNPITAASIVVSLLRTGPRAAAEELSELLFEPLLLNYPGELRKWLVDQSGNEPDAATPYLARALERLGDYLDELNAIGDLRELAASERERLIELHRRQIEMDVAFAAAREKSVISSLATRVTLLYGSGSIFHIYGVGGERHRKESKLSTIAHSFEASRQTILEPVEIEFLVSLYRVERMAE